MKKHFLALIGCVAVTSALVVAQAPDPKLVAKGKTLTVKNHCSMCHVLENAGGKIGKPLDGVKDRRDVASIKRILMDPLKEFPDEKVKMPPVTWAAGDVDAVIAYLETLKAPPAAK